MHAHCPRQDRTVGQSIGDFIPRLVNSTSSQPDERGSCSDIRVVGVQSHGGPRAFQGLRHAFLYRARPIDYTFVEKRERERGMRRGESRIDAARLAEVVGRDSIIG